MFSRTYTTKAIIIKRSNVGEADKVLTLLTPDRGKIKVLAKGIRWLKSHKAPSLELFSLTSVFIAKGKTLDLVTETKMLKSYANIRSDLEKVKYAYQFCELVNFISVADQSHRDIFSLLEKALHWLNMTSQPRAEGLRRFQRAILLKLGFGLPKDEDLHSLTRYIESIIERRLVTEKHFSYNNRNRSKNHE